MVGGFYELLRLPFFLWKTLPDFRLCVTQDDNC
jgi:hypothetical protein